MRNINIYVLILFLFTFSCNKSSNCKYCQNFLSKDLSKMYKYQKFVLEQDVYIFPNADSTGLGMPQTSGTTYLIDIDSLNYIRKSMFCFINMTYSKVNMLLPKQIPKKWDTVGLDYILKLYPMVGDWNPKYPVPQIRRRGYVKKITRVGTDSLTLHFKMVDGELIFTGDKDEIESYKSCYK